MTWKAKINKQLPVYQCHTISEIFVLVKSYYSISVYSCYTIYLLQYNN